MVVTKSTKQRAVLCDTHIDWLYRTRTNPVGIKEIMLDE